MLCEFFLSSTLRVPVFIVLLFLKVLTVKQTEYQSHLQMLQKCIVSVIKDLQLQFSDYNKKL